MQYNASINMAKRAKFVYQKFYTTSMMASQANRRLFMT